MLLFFFLNRSLFFVYEMQYYLNSVFFPFNSESGSVFIVFRGDQLVVPKEPNAVEFFYYIIIFRVAVFFRCKYKKNFSAQDTNCADVRGFEIKAESFMQIFTFYSLWMR